MLLLGFPNLFIDMAYTKIGIYIVCWVQWKRLGPESGAITCPTDACED